MKHKSIIKVLTLAVTLLAANTTLQARTVTFKASSLGKNDNLAAALNKSFKGLTLDDTAIIDFDVEGTFILDGTVDVRCNAVMSGLGTEKTVLVFNKDDKKPLKGSDAFMAFRGTLEHPITVSIHDLSIKLKEHNGIWWENSEFHGVKVYHTSKLDIRNVNSTMSNAKITNFDLRVCSNVNVENCTISNYNNCSTGGNLWLRGEMHNVNIHHNKIYKYGNDEAVAFFTKTVNANKNLNGNISRTNIKFTDNEVYYQHNGKLTEGLFNDMVFSVLTSLEDNEHCCDMRGFEVARNKFVTNDLCKRVIHFQFKPVDTHTDFIIHDNEFISNRVNSAETFYRMDIDVWDSSTQQDTIVVKNNTMTNNYAIMNPYNGSGYTFLLVRGGNVLLDGNKITNRITKGPKGKDYGINLLWSGQEGGAVTLRNNVCKGLARIITLESGNGIGQFSLKASNNYFQGRTSLYCRIIDRLDLDFRNNTFDCNHNSFFLQGFANKGTVVFNNNKVTVSTGNGKFMVDDTGITSSKLKFDKLEIKDNEFHGIKSEKEMTKRIYNVRKKSIKSNSYSKY